MIDPQSHVTGESHPTSKLSQCSFDVEPHYVHRPALYHKLEAQLQYAVHARRHELLKVVLCGPPGTGKTQLARKYLVDHYNDYSECLWINAISRETVEYDFANLYQQFHGYQLPAQGSSPAFEDIIHAIKSGDFKSPKPRIFVFDGADDMSLDLHNYFPTSQCSQVLITTRISLHMAFATWESVQVGRLERQEALEVFGKSSGLGNAPRDWAANFIVANLNFSATAVQTIGTDVKRSRLSSNLSFYLLMLQSRQAALPTSHFDGLNYSSHSVETLSLCRDSLARWKCEVETFTPFVSDPDALRFLGLSGSTIFPPSRMLYGGKRQLKQPIQQAYEYFGCAVLSGGTHMVFCQRPNSKVVDCRIHLTDVNAFDDDFSNKLNELLSSPLAAELLEWIPNDQVLQIDFTCEGRLIKGTYSRLPIILSTRTTPNALRDNHRTIEVIDEAIKSVGTFADHQFGDKRDEGATGPRIVRVRETAPPQSIKSTSEQVHSRLPQNEAFCFLVFDAPDETKITTLAENRFSNWRYRSKKPVRSLTPSPKLAIGEGRRWYNPFARLFQNLAFCAKIRLDPLSPGLQRIQWTCSCGQYLCDDYLEIVPGTLKKWEAYLHSTSIARGTSQVDSGSRGERTGKSNTFLSALQCLFSIIRGQWLSKSKNGLPKSTPYENIELGLGQGTLRRTNSCQWLLMCLPHRARAFRVLQLDVHDVFSDRTLFQNFRKQYWQMRGRFKHFLSFRVPTAIKFVQFDMYRNELADIFKHDAIPPEEKKDTYRYSPIPAERIPPVGPNLMMHYYEHPEEADVGGICLEKLPKKLREKLEACPVRGSSEGWGIVFEEGLSKLRLFSLGLIGILISALFGLMWSILRHDIQGGFAVAGYIMGIFVFTVGTFQAGLEVQ